LFGKHGNPPEGGLSKLGEVGQFHIKRRRTKKTWEARITLDKMKSCEIISEVCSELLDRVHELPDKRSIEILTDGLRWARKNISSMDYNTYSKKDKLQTSPNIICFQSVMHGIAARLKASSSNAMLIIVDRQSDFNNAQKFIAEIYRNTKHVKWESGPGLPVMDLKNIPDIPIQPTPGDNSYGLELVDIYIWIYKRMYEDKPIHDNLKFIATKNIQKSIFYEISIESLQDKFIDFTYSLPIKSEQDIIKSREILDIQEKRRRQYVI
jgi:hypothetical protein